MKLSVNINGWKIIVANITHSERSDECIDFTIITCRNNASIFNFSNFSGSKVNLIGIGTLRSSFFEFPNSFQRHRWLVKKVLNL
ncbi:Uncharacterized protein FWK35_00018708 [Aphis craccivora]|uniref:Uncharacterized protein n=1 Tax=Aphis craccivora TaxID=307492 RepID=A0A6G0YC91_APHCR|nr:Uncharacterized protein FWK35_00018708 [Aphis craccivora]